jgi:GH35 family endo-1,4-beta-xylanase
MPSLPRLQALQNGTHHLIVKNKPFLILGGELNNSSMSSAGYMKDIWPRMVANNMNTIFGPVAWEAIEPREGEFDFSEIDQIVKDAREFGLKLVVLWFGAYKNGMWVSTPIICVDIRRNVILCSWVG